MKTAITRFGVQVEKWAVIGASAFIVLGALVGAAAHDNGPPVLLLREWSYEDGTLTVKVGNSSRMDLLINSVGTDPEEHRVGGWTVEAMRTLTFRTTADTEPCVVEIDTDRGRMLVELDPFLRGQ